MMTRFAGGLACMAACCMLLACSGPSQVTSYATMCLDETSPRNDIQPGDWPHNVYTERWEVGVPKTLVMPSGHVVLCNKQGKACRHAITMVVVAVTMKKCNGTEVCASGKATWSYGSSVSHGGMTFDLPDIVPASAQRIHAGTLVRDYSITSGKPLVLIGPFGQKLSLSVKT